MSEAKTGDTVAIHYTGTFEDGTQFDSSAGREPLEFEVGGGQMIPGFDKAVEGMAVGDTKSVRLEPEEAYGPHYAELVQQVPRSALPEDLDPEEGMALQTKGLDGEMAVFVVTGVTTDEITVDANHPLAGKVLNFDIELLSIA